jgi:hypothetical protein
MPKYEDFKVGDTWICRDGKESLVVEVKDTPEGFCVSSYRDRDVQTHAQHGGAWNRGEYDRDLIRKKETHALDLAKPLRFKAGSGPLGCFSADDLENVPEPVTRKATLFAAVDVGTGHIPGAFDTRAEAEKYCKHGIVVELTGEYTV